MAVAVGHAARDARNARRASRIRMRASSPRIARVITAPFPDVNHARARRSLARSLAHLLLRTSPRRTCARDLGALVSATPPCMAPHPLCNTHGTHATHNTTRRQHDDDDDDDDPRACSGGGGGGARSLARSRARTCGGGCDGGGDRGL